MPHHRPVGRIKLDVSLVLTDTSKHEGSDWGWSSAAAEFNDLYVKSTFRGILQQTEVVHNTASPNFKTRASWTAVLNPYGHPSCSVRIARLRV